MPLSVRLALLGVFSLYFTHKAAGAADDNSNNTTGDYDADEEKCLGWAGAGECQENPNYMLKYCSKACSDWEDRMTQTNDEQKQRPIVSESLLSVSDLQFDENGKLAKHTVLYNSGKCAGLVERAYKTDHHQMNFDFYAATDEAEATFFQGSDWSVLNPTNENIDTIDDCRAICLERGVDRSVIAAPIDHRRFRGSGGGHDDEEKEKRTFEHWFKTACQQTEVGFINYRSKDAPLNVYWGHREGEKRGLVHKLEYGERKTWYTLSFLGHWFLLEDSVTGEVVRTFRVDFTSTIGIGDAPPHGQLRNHMEVSKKIEQTLQHEWVKKENVHRTFSPLGFKKGRLPDDLWAEIEAFYYNNRMNKVREEWGGKGVFVNWWEVDVHFIQIPWRSKVRWQERLRVLVEAWVGEPLEQTDMYGLRQYNEGARLLTHVDRETTHAASLIVNVAQGNVSSPWPVEIHDHAGRLHQVTMEPGEIVYYESAACLHARNTPLKGSGSYYVNMFTHYRPTGDPDWQFKKNRPGQTEPLMDVGECHLEGTVDMIGQGAVKCENPAIGQYLSPYMVTAKSGDDLFDWWVRVSPETPPNNNNAPESNDDEL